MNTTLQIGFYRCATYCYGGYKDIPFRNVGSFADCLGAEREKADAAEEKPEETRTGLSDGDVEYLKEHYSGELTAVEVVCAVRMVYSMGGMTRAEYCAAWGARMARGDIFSVPAHPELFTDAELCDARFESAPITGFHSLNDILKWLDELRGDDPEWELLRMALANE